MQVTVHDSIATIDGDEWNSVAGNDSPFLRHEFLHLAEASGCVSAATGWSPRHITLHRDGQLRAAMPLYEKSHSWGEFVFDWAWANAYSRAGLDYYPKLVSAVPFTPAAGPRLLLANRDDEHAAKDLLHAALTLARDTKCSSLHVLFPTAAELATFQDAGFLIRKDCQFHWHNCDYRSFDDFLATFTSAKRKKARRDRRRVLENGIRFRRIRGTDMDAQLWATVYALVSRTFMIRGSAPYYSERFFRDVGRQIPEAILVVLAEHENVAVAAAVFFDSHDTLYGRYWGSNGHFDALHFETCYYQGIDYCIEIGRQAFEPGTQGEHKISRGFSPVSTWSAHWLAHAEFADAIENYLQKESEHVDRYMDAVESHSPYKNGSEFSDK